MAIERKVSTLSEGGSVIEKRTIGVTYQFLASGELIAHVTTPDTTKARATMQDPYFSVIVLFRYPPLQRHSAQLQCTPGTVANS